MRSESSHASRAAIPPPLETPVTKTRASSTQAESSRASSDVRSSTTSSGPVAGGAPEMSQNDRGPTPLG